MSNETLLHSRLLQVLIVEDEPTIASAIGFLVEEAGYQSLFAANGREALALLEQQRVALIITDLMMPVMGGDELIRTLRARCDHAEIPPLVVMTAAGKSYARRCEADYILEKPFDIEVVEALLQQVLT